MTMLLKAQMLTGKSLEAAKEFAQTIHVYHMHNFPYVLHRCYMQQSVYRSAAVLLQEVP